MRNIIITGGAGFIGSHFTDFIIKKGYSPIIIDDLSYGKKNNLNPKAIFQKESVTNFNRMEEIILENNPSHIIHFAANATTKTSSMGWNDPFLDYKINMVGTLNLLEIIRKHSLETHLIYASSAAVYGEPLYVPIDEKHPQNPLSPYGISKLIGEKYCNAYYNEFGVKITIMRIFNTYGPRQPRYVMFEQIKKMLNATTNNITVLGTGEQIRDYVYVYDTVNAFFLAMQNPKQSIGETFNIGSNSQIKIKELINIIIEKLGKNLHPEYSGTSWKGDINRLWAKSTKIKTELNWHPTISIDQGLKQLIEWVIKENIQ